jgi:hypothetical protein
VNVFVVATLVAAASCGGDSPTDGDIGDESFEGFYELTVDVTVANGVCAGEVNEPASVINALITQEGTVITATAMWTDESGSVSLTGSRTGNQITFGGSYAEDGGTTTTSYTLTIGTDSLSGTESWSWIGEGVSCPGGFATVTGVKIG